MPIKAELIRVRPSAAQNLRRRLVLAGATEGAERFPVQVSALDSEGCVASGHPRLGDVEGHAWLKLPGFEPFQITAIAEGELHLVCRFAQPLPPATVRAIAHPHRDGSQHPEIRPRCTFL